MKGDWSFFKSSMQCIAVIFLALLVRVFVYGLYQVPTGSMETTLLVGDVLVGDKLSYWWSSPDCDRIIVFNNPSYTYSDNRLVRLSEQYLFGPENVTKRVIGIPGDHIVGAIKDHKPVVYRNGELLSESYVNQYPLILVDDTVQEMSLDIKSTDTGAFKSYDPDRPYDAQPFYVIDEKSIVRTHTKDPFIRMPHTPVSDTQPHVSHDAVDYWDGSDIFNVTLKAHQYWVMGDNRRNSFDSRMFGPIDAACIRARIFFRLFSIDTSFSWSEVIYTPWCFFKYIRWQRCLEFVPSHDTTIKE